MSQYSPPAQLITWRHFNFVLHDVTNQRHALCSSICNNAQNCSVFFDDTVQETHISSVELLVVVSSCLNIILASEDAYNDAKAASAEYAAATKPPEDDEEFEKLLLNIEESRTNKSRSFYTTRNSLTKRYEKSWCNQSMSCVIRT